MKQINLYDYFVLGKALGGLSKWKPDMQRELAEDDLIVAAEQLREVRREDSPFLQASRSAAIELLNNLETQFEDEVRMGFFGGDSSETLSYKVVGTLERLRDFDTAFRLDAPHIMTFTAPQKGIYDTEHSSTAPINTFRQVSPRNSLCRLGRTWTLPVAASPSNYSPPQRFIRGGHWKLSLAITTCH